MQVKKFEAPTMQEALAVIKRELGPDAIILSTKQNRGGFGLMSKGSVEVTAAIAEKDLKKKILAEKNLPNEVKEKIWNSKASTQAEVYNNYFEKQLKRASNDKVELSAAKKRQEAAAQQDARQQQQNNQNKKNPFAGASSKNTSAATSAKVKAERRYAEIDEEEVLAQINANQKAAAAVAAPVRSNYQQPAYAREQDSEKVRSLENDIEQLKNMIADLSTAAPKAEDTADASGLTQAMVHAMHELIASGIEKKLARQLIRQASFELSAKEQEDETFILERIAYQMIQEIQVKDPLEHIGATQGKSKTTVIALVGPTGVGKTTTIAKIASLGILEKRLRVGLINLDSYKVAAADQLATYAKIMNVAFRSVTTKEELQQAIYDFSSLDLVLIDTTGRSQKDQESLLQLRHVLAGIDGLQTILMMSATTKDADMGEVVSRFRLFNPIGLVFSKLDETSVYGCIYNTQKKTQLPLLYFTVGQRVPEDIEKASAERVVDLVIDL